MASTEQPMLCILTSILCVLSYLYFLLVAPFLFVIWTFNWALVWNNLSPAGFGFRTTATGTLARSVPVPGLFRLTFTLTFTPGIIR